MWRTSQPHKPTRKRKGQDRAEWEWEKLLTDNAAGMDLELPPKHATPKAYEWAIHKQAGASRWAIRLGKLIERLLEDPNTGHNVTMGGVYGDIGPVSPGCKAFEV